MNYYDGSQMSDEEVAKRLGFGGVADLLQWSGQSGIERRLHNALAGCAILARRVEQKQEEIRRLKALLVEPYCCL